MDSLKLIPYDLRLGSSSFWRVSEPGEISGSKGIAALPGSQVTDTRYSMIFRLLMSCGDHETDPG